MQAGRLHHKWRASKSQEDTSVSEAFDPYHVWLGIPPEEQPPNHYRLLGVALFEGQADVIDTAADRQMGHLRTFQSRQALGPFAAVAQRGGGGEDLPVELREEGRLRRAAAQAGAAACGQPVVAQDAAAADPAMGGHPRLAPPTARTRRVAKKRQTSLGPMIAVATAGALLLVAIPGPQRHSSGGQADRYDKKPLVPIVRSPPEEPAAAEDGT